MLNIQQGNNTALSKYQYRFQASYKGSHPKKKPYFGHYPKVALTPSPLTPFGHPWGNFRLSRLRKKHTIKKYLKTT